MLPRYITYSGPSIIRPLINRTFHYPNCWNDGYLIKIFCLKCAFYKSILNFKRLCMWMHGLWLSKLFDDLNTSKAQWVRIMERPLYHLLSLTSNSWVENPNIIPEILYKRHHWLENVEEKKFLYVLFTIVKEIWPILIQNLYTSVLGDLPTMQLGATLYYIPPTPAGIL